MIMGGYRQWTIPAKLNIPNSNHPHKQMERLVLIQNQIINALNTGNQVLIGWDSNLDTLEANDPLGRDDTKAMYEDYVTLINEKDLSWHNTKPTCHRVGQRSSCLDHFISNCPNNIHSVSQRLSHIADHELIRLTYQSNEIITKPQFKKIRNTSKLTRDNLLPLLITNSRLLSSLSMTNVDSITNTVLEEFNSAANTIAPFKIIQIKKNQLPFYNEDAKLLLKEANSELSEAIARDEIDQWRIYKRKRNQALEYIEQLKTSYYFNILNSSKDMWKSVKNLTGSFNSAIPTRVNIGGVMTSSPRKLANAFNIFFKEKIVNICSSFTAANMPPIQVLEN